MSEHCTKTRKFSFISSFIVITESLLIMILASSLVDAQHNPGKDCFTCHPDFKIAGTVFSDSTGLSVQSDVQISLTDSSGNHIVMDQTNIHGNFSSPILSSGTYLIQVGQIACRTWHTIPGQESCNRCHIVGGNGSDKRTKKFPIFHTTVPSNNDCRHCHHFPATQSLEQLMTAGVLNTAEEPLPLPDSQVEIAGQRFSFDPSQYNINSVRSDIFAPGYFSMFDVILAVADSQNIPIEYHYDAGRKTHFITRMNGISDDYWYHFSYDAGDGRRSEIRYRRANRWDETLWRPGVWIQVVTGENLAEIKQEYLEEIQRENSNGHQIPRVNFSISPTDYAGNPPESHRITVNREFQNIPVTAHNLRSTGYPSPYSKPFQPGVVTSLDILLSLKDQDKLNVVTGAFYTYFSGHYIDSYYVVELGFPDVGTAHASGRQGFVYTTENGTYNRLPNNADRKFHITSDISVIHAPDFSYWRWIELGNPYYESEIPTKIEQSIVEDYEAISRGFNLHAPYPNPFNNELNISFNLFEPGEVEVIIYNVLGQEIATLINEQSNNIGIRQFKWRTEEASSGTYYVVMKFNEQVQVREVIYLK